MQRKLKTVDVPSRFIGYDISDESQHILGRQFFYDMDRFFGNLDEFIYHPDYLYMGAANSNCDVFYYTRAANHDYPLVLQRVRPSRIL